MKAELIALYDGGLEFDSEELENLTFDWDDIRELRTGRVVQVRFKNQTQRREDCLSTRRPSACSGTPSSSSIEPSSITPGEPTESSYWSGNVQLRIQPQTRQFRSG